jgi:hypothetical protein
LALRACVRYYGTMLEPVTLRAFVEESNRIEGITRPAHEKEVLAHQRFLAAPLSISGLREFVAVVQPQACLRDRMGLDVRVGNYTPPAGGPYVSKALANLLEKAVDPYSVHQQYEMLHPFTDGNGRSGRAMWLWLMGGISNAPLGFLHHWYYQSLQSCSIATLNTIMNSSPDP